MANISIVTVSMNRTEHLLKSAEAVSNISIHSEHIILDFGSLAPIRRTDLPSDKRIKLYRTESPNGKWWLTHAFNLGFSLSSGDFILKLDSDALLSQGYLEDVCKQQIRTKAHLMCAKLTLQDWSLPSNLVAPSGIFFCNRQSLAHISAFNPYLQGWGWDEIDLYCRFFLNGYSVSQIPGNGLRYIEHNDDLREEPLSTCSASNVILRRLAESISSTKRMNAQNIKNKFIAISSLRHQVRWPTLEEYALSYRLTGKLPLLAGIQLFSQEETSSLVKDLRRILLAPSRFQHAYWIICSSIGIGPYTNQNTYALLNMCNISLDLVT